MTKAGYKGTNSALALSWKNWGKSIKELIYGCIAIFDYGHGKGHVGFVVAKTGERILILRGNQSDQVKETIFNTKLVCSYVIPENFDLHNKTNMPTISNEVKETGNYASTR